MHIQRHATGVGNPKHFAEKYLQYTREDTEKVSQKTIKAKSCADNSLYVAQYAVLDDPRASERETRHALLLVAQAGSAFFRSSYESDETFEHSIGEPVSMRSIAPGRAHNAHRWLNALWSCLVCRKTDLAAILCNVPTSTLRGSGAHSEEYLYLWTEALTSFLRGAEETYQHILASMREADPSTVQNEIPEVSLMRFYPQMKTLFHLTERDPTEFNSSLRRAVELHKEFWSTEDRANDPEGFFSLPLTGIAAMAHDLGISVEIESDYLPSNLVTGTFTN